MKFLFDIFPVILFFAAFKGAEYFPDGALSLASSFMGDGVTATTAPVFIATVTAILATILQVGWLKLKGAKVEPMLWISLAVIMVFGGLTLWLKNEMFIKWKPTILYWIFAAVLGYGAHSGRSFIRMLMLDIDIYNCRCRVDDKTSTRSAELIAIPFRTIARIPRHVHGWKGFALLRPCTLKETQKSWIKKLLRSAQPF